MTSVSSIAQTATALQRVSLQNKVAVAVAQKQQDAAKQSGDAAVKLIEAAADVSSGRVDYRA